MIVNLCELWLVSQVMTSGDPDIIVVITYCWSNLMLIKLHEASYNKELNYLTVHTRFLILVHVDMRT